MPVQPVILVIAIVFAGVILVRLASAWLKFRGERVITCPENRRPAGVRVDARHAAATSLGKVPELRLSNCSRWPERAGCGQQCLSQVAESPEDCLVRNILAKWYDDKVCVSCHQPIGKIDWAGVKPALLRKDQISVEWNQISADELHEVLASSLPLCFACHMASTLVREHPELVVDRTTSHRI